LSGQANTLSLLGAAGLGVVCMGLWLWQIDPAQWVDVWLLAALAWSLLAVFALYSGAARWLQVPPQLRYIGGLVLLLASWLALVQSKQVGTNFLLSVMALVWVSDVCAYFAGRAFGGRWIARKLAVTISPGKTWEGVAGAVLGVGLMALVWAYADSLTLGVSLSIFSLPWVRSFGAPIAAATSETCSTTARSLEERPPLNPGYGLGYGTP
jgi:phosphatidate cytidylyltransferase